MKKEFNNPLKKALITLGIFILIGISSKVKSYILILLIILLYFKINKISLKKIYMFFIPGIIFILPTLLVDGIMLENGKLTLNINYLILFRVLASLATISFYSINITIKDIYYTLKKIKIPDFICEITIYMFKFLTIMLKNYKEANQALKNRGAFRKIKTSYRDTALLFSQLFYKIYRDMDNFNIALKARGYNGKLNFYPLEYRVEKKWKIRYGFYFFLSTILLKGIENV